MITHVRPLAAHIVRIPTDESLPLQYWAIDGLPRVNGKRQRKFFRTKDAAERELVTVKKKLRKEARKPCSFLTGYGSRRLIVGIV